MAAAKSIFNNHYNFSLSIIGFPGVFGAKLHTLTIHKAQTLSKSLLPTNDRDTGNLLNPYHPQKSSDQGL